MGEQKAVAIVGKSDFESDMKCWIRGQGAKLALLYLVSWERGDFELWSFILVGISSRVVMGLVELLLTFGLTSITL
jgi:hypothetical protein